MKKKPVYNKDIVLYHSQFIAWFNYNKQSKTLLVIMRTGKQYEYEKVPVEVIKRLMDATNKGSYLYHNIMKIRLGKLLPDIVAPAIIEDKLKPPPISNWLAQ